MTVPDDRPALRPLLKWAGGKRQLLPALRRHYPEHFRRYVEPFVGSGAVFFDLLSLGRLAGRQVRLVDLNADLIGCYLTVRDHVNEVTRALEVLKAEHAARGAACFYEVRDCRFNPLRARNGGIYTPELAAMLIYLNRTGFNGLFRLNQSGEFNVPAGRYVNPRIVDGDHLRAVADAFGAPGVSIECRTFEETLADTGPGDFVYCDPPYAALSRTSSFSSYTADGFSASDQLNLRNAVVAAAGRGAAVVVSNSSAPMISAAYGSNAAKGAGLILSTVQARRAINSNGGQRGLIDEVIVSNTWTLASHLTGQHAKLRMARSLMPSATGSRRRKSA